MTTRTARPAGLLLAAGAGRRMGRPKALLPHRGRPLLEHAVQALREGGCGTVYVVLGAVPPEEVRRSTTLTEAPDAGGPEGAAECRLLYNPGWEEGMGSSLRLGLRALGEEAGGPAAALVTLVDQPGIGAAAVARVRAAHRSPDSLAAAAYEGRRGHPVLLGSAHWDGVARSTCGDRGARDYLRERAEELLLVECGDIADPSDLDTPEDAERLA